MLFSEPEVRKLLDQHFVEIDARWEKDPYQESLTWALVIKEFMRDHSITVVAEGIERFKQFKAQQAGELARLGFGSRPELAPSSELAPLAA